MFIIFDKFINLDKNKKLIVILLVVFVILVIGNNILKSRSKQRNTQWSYKDIDSASSIIYQGTDVNERKIYWQIKDIIYDFIYTLEDEEFDEEEKNESKVEYTEYYEVLSKEYKKEINKKEFDIVAKKFINKFLSSDHLGDKYVSDFKITHISLFDENRYLCAVENLEYESEAGYIGIELDELELTFKIFYIE